MTPNIKMPICSGTNRPIAPDDKGATSFPCPNCGKYIIYRSSKARKFSNEYKCPLCGFVGP